MNTGDEQASAEELAVPQVEYAKILVDRLRLRDKPVRTSNTLKLLPKDGMVILSGEQSETKEKININGELANDYWYKIIFKKDTGWVYGGGLRRIENIAQEENFFIIPGKKVGWINASDSEDDLRQKFGDDAVKNAAIDIGNGERVGGTLLFPDTEKELKIFWEDEERTNIFEIRIDHPSSPWITENKIKIGTKLAQVHKLNKDHFLFAGFDETGEGGLVYNWQDGDLSKNLKLGFRIVDPSNVHERLYEQNKLYSDDLVVEKADFEVDVIKIYFNK